MRYAPSFVVNTTIFFLESSVKKRGKKIEEPAIRQEAKKRGKKLQFSPEVVKVPSKLVTRSATKNMPIIHTSQALNEAPEEITKINLPDDKDNLIIELQEQLNKTHFVIA
jgi:hypothetical protein